MCRSCLLCTAQYCTVLERCTHTPTSSRPPPSQHPTTSRPPSLNKTTAYSRPDDAADETPGYTPPKPTQWVEDTRDWDLTNRASELVWSQYGRLTGKSAVLTVRSSSPLGVERQVACGIGDLLPHIDRLDGSWREGWGEGSGWGVWSRVQQLGGKGQRRG